MVNFTYDEYFPLPKSFLHAHPAKVADVKRRERAFWYNIDTEGLNVSGSYHEKENDDMSMDREEVIQSRIAELEAELAQRRRYGRDTYDDGTVLSWEKTYEDTIDQVFRYAAIKAGDVWYVTGSKASSVRYTWDKLIQLWVSGNPVETVRRVAAWMDLTAPKPEVVAEWKMEGKQ